MGSDASTTVSLTIAFPPQSSHARRGPRACIIPGADQPRQDGTRHLHIAA